MSKATILTSPAFCWVLAGMLLGADPPKQDTGLKDPVEVTGYLNIPKRFGDEPIYISIRGDTAPTKLPLVVGKLKDWPAERIGKAYVAGGIVRATGTLELRKIQVRPGVTEEHLAFVASSMVLNERKPDPPPPFAQPLGLPQGVIHVALPAGTVRFENVVSKGKPIIRFSAGGMTIDTERLFIGDGRIAVEMVVDKDGMYWPSPTGARGLRDRLG